MNEEQMKHIANLISQDIEKDKEIDRLNNIIDKLEKILENEWIYYDQIVFNTHAEFDDEEKIDD